MVLTEWTKQLEAIHVERNWCIIKTFADCREITDEGEWGEVEAWLVIVAMVPIGRLSPSVPVSLTHFTLSRLRWWVGLMMIAEASFSPPRIRRQLAHWKDRPAGVLRNSVTAGNKGLARALVRLYGQRGAVSLFRVAYELGPACLLALLHSHSSIDRRDVDSVKLPFVAGRTSAVRDTNESKASNSNGYSSNERPRLSHSPRLSIGLSTTDDDSDTGHPQTK